MKKRTSLQRRATISMGDEAQKASGPRIPLQVLETPSGPGLGGHAPQASVPWMQLSGLVQRGCSELSPPPTTTTHRGVSEPLLSGPVCQAGPQVDTGDH